MKKTILISGIVVALLLAGVATNLILGNGFLGASTHTITWDGTKDIFSPTYLDDNASAVSLGTTAGSAPDLVAVNNSVIETRCFDGSGTMEQVWWSKELNHNWKEGTAISPHVHWLPSESSTGSVVWNLDYYITKDNGTVLTSSSVQVSTTATFGTAMAWESTTTVFSNITLTNNKIGTQIYFRLWRDGDDSGDTYEHDACVATMGYHYQVDTLGSGALYTK